MLTGSIAIGSNPNFNLFSHTENGHHNVAQRLYRSNGDQDYNGLACQDLDVEQRASASLLSQEAQEKTNAPSNFNSSPLGVSQSTSVSSPDQVSVSPAARFLSTFSSPPSLPLPDSEGNIISGYTLGSIIGYGAFSTIRRASSISGGIVAVKIIQCSDVLKQGNASPVHKRVKHEAAVWSTFSHEHILPLFSFYHTSYAYYFFTLLCPAGSLFDILKRDGCPALPQDDAGMMFRQVVRGLRYLHEVALSVHRDIKLENVLVDEMGVCKIGDFGMTRKIGESDEDEDEIVQEQNDESDLGHATLHRAVSLAIPPTKRHLHPKATYIARHRNSTSSLHPSQSTHIYHPGSLPYTSPELLLPQISGPLLPHPCQDIWALGVLLYSLLTGHLPFVDSFEPRLQMKIINGVYEVPSGIGRGTERVLRGCLDRSVTSRWTIAMVDEVAWNIGWGAEGDEFTPAESDEEFQTYPSSKHVTSPPHSRYTREPTILEDPEWQNNESRSRPSLEAASRRSLSRIRRSLSRAPIHSRSISAKRNVSRPSRQSSPSSSIFSSSILNTDIGSASSSHSLSFCDSPYVTSPSLERGRRLRKEQGRSLSRSPSPSVVPTTPIDTISQFSSPRKEPERSDNSERSASRGRPKYSRNSRTSHSNHLYSTGGGAPLELDILDETADWTIPNTMRRFPTTAEPFSSSLSAHSLCHDKPVRWRTDRSLSESPSDEAKITKRPGSSPPVPRSIWPLIGVNGLHNCAAPLRTSNFSGGILATPAKLTHSFGGLTRSKSLELSRP